MVNVPIHYQACGHTIELTFASVEYAQRDLKAGAQGHEKCMWCGLADKLEQAAAKYKLNKQEK